jgi:nucleoside-diphosphate-sugar epimerase
MADVLILGGTGWLGGRIAARWGERGAEGGARVTCVARGGREAPEGARLVVADRSLPAAYDELAGRDWDEIVDVSSHPRHVQEAVDALGDRTAHWTYVSSLSVYAANDRVDTDESERLAEPAEGGDPGDYSRAKAACEGSVAALGRRGAVVRPGLIVGPGDPTDRFGYWPARFALAGDEPVLVPSGEGLRAQVIDVDDLAEFVVDAGARAWHGVVNAIGPSVPLEEVLDSTREVAGHTGDVVRVPPSWLEAHEVAPWAGPRSLPLWLPDDMPGFATRRNDAYLEAGGRIRPLAETISRVLADERARGLERERHSGLTRDEELDLLARV